MALSSAWRISLISIHALHEESDSGMSDYISEIIFQSTLSMRRATDLDLRRGTVTVFQSTLSMRRATGQACSMTFLSSVFQSTLSMRRATSDRYEDIIDIKFQSTLSMRRATALTYNPTRGKYISIHALHEESDRSHQATCSRF